MFNNWNWKQLALPLLLIGALLINKTLVQPPAPKHANAPESEFSAERAMEHVRRIATEPHAVGMPANKRVRDELVAHLTAAGLDVEVQSTQIIDTYSSTGPAHYAGLPRHRHSAAYVNNVIAKLKGTSQQGKALVLMSHYDSVYYGPGAGDDAAGTATLLEIVRALQAGEPLSNDVILLITDAEEVGLFGAQAFFEKHRWADEVGLVLNFEARGSKGPVSMFQTSALNDQLVEVFSKSVERPLANSLTVTIYRNMPNDTDMSISLRKDIPGMNFAFIEGFYDYHTKGDNPDNLSIATLQHMGDQGLAMTRAMGNLALPLEDTSEVVFFDVLTLFMVSYPIWGSWVLLGVAVLLFGLYAKKLAASGDVKFGGTLRGLIGGLLLLLVFALLTDILYLMIGGRSGDFVEGRRLFALADYQLLGFSLIGFALTLAWFRAKVRGFGMPWLIAGGVLTLALFLFENSWIAGAVSLAIVAIGTFLLRAPISDKERLVSGLALYLMFSICIQFLAPAGSHLFVLPLVLMIGALMLAATNERAALGVTVVGGLLGALWLLYFTEMGYSALGISFPGVIAAPFGLLLLLLVPAFLHIVRLSHQHVAGISAILGLALIGYSAVATGFTERLNRPTEVFYLIDGNEDGTNQYATRLREQDAWSSQLIKGDTSELDSSEILPRRSETLTLASAPSSSVQRISISDIAQSQTGTSFRLNPGYRGDIMLVELSSTEPLTEIEIAGEKLPKGDTPPTSIILYYFAVPDTGLPLTITTDGELSVHAAEVTSDWPEDIAPTIPAKPNTIMRAPYRLSDSTVSYLKHVFKPTP